jgi:hypothetical protein
MSKLAEKDEVMGEARGRRRVRDITFWGDGQKCSSFKGPQAVPARPSGRGTFGRNNVLGNKEGIGTIPLSVPGKLLLVFDSAVNLVWGPAGPMTILLCLTTTVWTRSTPLKVKVRFTLQLAVYCQSVRLGTKPFEVYDQRFSFLQLNPCGHSP